MGESIHTALHHFFHNPDMNSRTREYLHTLLRQHWKRDGYHDVEEERRYGLQALDMLDRYYFHNDMKVTPFLLEYGFSIPVGNYTLLGKIDRVDREADGSYTLTDYKTGQRALTTTEAATDMQLTFYALAFYKKYGEVCARLKLQYLALGLEVETTRTVEQLDQAVIEIGNMVEAIRLEKEFAPKPNPFCHNCPYNILCPVSSPREGDELQRLDATNRRLYTLLTASTRLAQSELNVNTVLERTLEIIMEISRCDQSAIIWTTEDKTVVEGARFFGMSPEVEEEFYGRGAVQKVLQDEKPYLYNVETEGGDEAEGNMLYLPLKTRQNCWGIFFLHRPATLPFSQADYLYYQAYTLQAAIALENAIHYNRAICDGMTGLFNHAHFKYLLQKEIRRAYAGHQQVGLFMFDIDNFKKFNDTYGHAVGDLVLQETARVARETVRAGDLTSRYGGEEFAIILPATDACGSLAIAQRVRQAIENNQVAVGGEKLCITISGGVGIYPDNADGYLSLIEYADEGLYLSKRAGKNRVSIKD